VPPNHLTALTLFAGAGGADYGLAQAGFEHARCIEYDKHAHATLCAAGFPGVLGDVRDPTLYRDLPPIDLLWASPPCQDWSSAGKREGANGSRNGWPWTWAVVRHLQRRGLGPRWFIAENVTGMLTHNTSGGCGKTCCQDPNVCPRTYFFEVLLPQARELFGWADFIVMDAADYGTPQFRRRVFLVAGPHRLRWPTPTHGEATQQETLFGRRLKPWRTVREALGLRGVFGGGSRGHGMAEWRPAELDHRPAACVNAMQSSTAGLYVRTEQRGAVAVAVDNPSPTVPTVGNQYLHRGDPGTRAASEPERLDRPAPTVCAYPDGKGCGQWSANQSDREALAAASGRRRLTVAEVAALFDMPPDYPWQGTKTSQYTQVGNMVAWKCAAALGRAVSEADRTPP